MAEWKKWSQDDFDEMEEPSVISMDPNERKLARRLRIQRRLEALKKQEGPEEEEVVEKTSTERQILASAELLEKLILEGNEVISNVRVANDAREVQRRKEEKEIRSKLLSRLEEESEESLQKYKQISSKWPGILGSNDPLDIHSEMEAQNADCLKVFESKNCVIAELKQELENADVKFFEDQEKQNDDINLLIERIDNQVNTMAKVYHRELILIQNAIDTERKVLLKVVSKKWDGLFRQRNEEEINGIEERKEIMQEYEKEMKRVVIEHQEETRAQKIWLETQYEKLQQDVEHIKFLCMMNIEKLDYSYAVLKRREDENTIIKGQQKRRINKLQDVINGLKKNYAELEENTKMDIQKLTEQVMKAHKNILELERKSDHFTRINEKQYLQIWDMNAKKAEGLVEKILTVDRIIHEQALGLEWEPPDEPLLTKEDLQSYRSATSAIEQKKAETKETMKVCEPFKVATTLQDLKMERQLLNRIVTQISDKSGFLIEEKLRGLLGAYTCNDKTIITLGNVFRALDMKSEEEVDLLLNFFLPYAYCPTCHNKEEVTFNDDEPSDKAFELTMCLNEDTCPDTFEDNRELSEDSEDNPESRGSNESSTISGEATSQEFHSSSSAVPRMEEFEFIKDAGTNELRQREVSCKKGHLLDIHPAYVMKALKEFVAKYHVIRRGEATPSFQTRLTQEKLTVSRNLTVEDVTEFWRRYRDIFSTKKEKLWDGLLIGLHKYHEILKERHRLNLETKRLRRQNAELRRLLEIYMLKPGHGLAPIETRSTISLD
ncbi:dynein regulatory complex protein 1 isoform X2 [Cephus cinctus]|nr:dynein regulatory complex protein 1 isoform X2 [Cephus cinctus]XP_015599309.1 dynein regulatory complex protein 1 isoform X2 [Cephus cinctus]XP_024942793.1 dynein regulatory complex protein 1 isoform X2 [Cephus cinctus]